MGNKIADAIATLHNDKTTNISSRKIHRLFHKEKKSIKILKEIYLSPNKRQQIINALRLI